MPAADVNAQPKTIVVPRQLEGFFYEKLRQRYAGRSDVTVVVDRRQAERRRQGAPAAAPIRDRRRGERRSATEIWSIDEMPFAGA
jgi:hypothetical protein